MIIQYYADSLGLSRPGIVKLNERYIHLFELWLRQTISENVSIINRARKGLTIDKMYEIFEEDESYLLDEAERDILIIHDGICDCAPRPVSKKLRAFISKLPGFFRIRLVSYLHNNRAKLLKKGHVHFLVEKNQYEEYLHKWLKQAIGKFKRIYIFNIAPTNTEIESHSPGFGNSIVAYNSIIERVVNDINNPIIKLIDIYSIIKKEISIDDVIVKEDGHHITAVGHKLYAKQLIELEAKRLSGTC